MVKEEKVALVGLVVLLVLLVGGVLLFGPRDSRSMRYSYRRPSLEVQMQMRVNSLGHMNLQPVLVDSYNGTQFPLGY